MDLEQKLKLQLGDLVFQVNLLSMQLEQAMAEIKKLKEEKDGSDNTE